MGGACGTHAIEEKFVYVLVGCHEGNTQLGRKKHSLDGNITACLTCVEVVE